jgi:hypothetical protein
MVAGNVLTALGAAGNIALALSQAPLYLQMYREGCSDKYSPIPSLALSCVMSLWGGYTVWYLPLPQIYAANFCGFLIPFVYLCIHAALASTLARRAGIFLGTVFALGLTWAFSAGVFLGPGVANPVDVSIGVTAACSFGFFLAPLRPLFTALQQLDLTRVSLTLSLVQVVQSIVWILAGYFIGDVFITWMNSVGLAFAVLQVGCWLYIFLRTRAAAGKQAPPPPPPEAASTLDVRAPQA